MGDFIGYFLEAPKGWPAKCLSHEFRQGENWRKRPYVHRAMEMKQPHAMTERSIKPTSSYDTASIKNGCGLESG